MAETIFVGLIAKEDINFGYGTYTSALIDGTISATLSKLNLSPFYGGYTVTYSATPIFDLQNGVVQTITMTGNIASSVIQNGLLPVPAGARIVLRIIQDSTGSRTFGWPPDVNGSALYPVSPVPGAISRAELQFNGLTWDFVAVPMISNTGAPLSSFLGSTGVSGFIPKYASASTLTNSALNDLGNGLVQMNVPSSATTKFWIVNPATGSTSKAQLTVGGNVAVPDDIDISLSAQKSGNSTNSWGLAGVVRTGVGAIGGLVLSTAAGNIRFQPGGTTTRMGLFHSVTPLSVLYNLEIGTTGVGSDDGAPLSVYRAQDRSTDVVLVNSSAGTSARCLYRAIAGADLNLGMTGANYNLAGVGASTGFIHTGATAAGLLFLTETGPISFQPGNLVAPTTSMTVNEIQHTGRLRAMSLSRVTPASGSSVDIYKDGNSGVIASALWTGTESTCTMHALNPAGSTIEFYTGTTFSTLSSRMSLILGLQVGVPTGGDKGAGTINVSADIYKNNSSFSNPDFVFEHWVTGRITEFKDNPGASDYPGPLSIDATRQYVREHMQLPRVSTASGVFERADIVLEKLEEAYLHIFELEQRIRSLEAR